MDCKFPKIYVNIEIINEHPLVIYTGLQKRVEGDELYLHHSTVSKTQWLPISMAPTDGTTVPLAVYDDIEKEFYVEYGFYSKDGHWCVEEFEGSRWVKPLYFFQLPRINK